MYRRSETIKDLWLPLELFPYVKRAKTVSNRNKCISCQNWSCQKKDGAHEAYQIVSHCGVELQAYFVINSQENRPVGKRMLEIGAPFSVICTG